MSVNDNLHFVSLFRFIIMKMAMFNWLVIKISRTLYRFQ